LGSDQLVRHFPPAGDSLAPVALGERVATRSVADGDALGPSSPLQASPITERTIEAASKRFPHPGCPLRRAGHRGPARFATRTWSWLRM